MFNNTVLTKKSFNYLAVSLCLFLFNSSPVIAEGCNFWGNCINGKGTYTYSDGRVYVGAWVDGHQEGQGVLIGGAVKLISCIFGFC